MIFLKSTSESLQLTASAGTQPPTIKGSVHAQSDASANVTLTPDASIADGDWMMIIAATYNVPTITPPSGWTTLLSPTDANTLRVAVYGKMRQSSDGASYTLGYSTGTISSDATLLWGSGAIDVSSWIVGSVMLRANITPTTTFNNVAPSLTTTNNHNLVLAISAERTTADEGGISGYTGSNFQPYRFFPQNGSSDIQTTWIGQYNNAPAGTTGDVTITYPNTQATNGLALQIALPQSTAAALDYSISYDDDGASGQTKSSSEGKVSSVSAGGATYTLYPTDTPSSFTTNDPAPGNGVELGTVFTSSVAGYILGLRFYKAPGSTVANNAGNLWTQSGSSLIGTLTFSNQTASGWQTAYFSSPVAVSANTQYIASYFLPGSSGAGYGNTTNYFNTDRTNGPLTGVYTGNAVNGNGVYAYSATSTFPNNSYTQSAYFADVIFSTTPGVAAVLSAPPASTNRIVRQMTVTNTHATNSAVLSLTKQTASSSYKISPTLTVNAGEMAQYIDGFGWRTYAANGVTKGDQSINNASSTDIIHNNNKLLKGAYGSGWQVSSASSLNWYSMTSSSDGRKMAATVQNGYIYTSVNGGSTWTQQSGSTSAYWYSIAGSGDGTKLVAINGTAGYLNLSVDSGVTWTQLTSAGSRGWRSVAMSSDGSRIAAGDHGYNMWTSADGGGTWTQQTSTGNLNWSSLTMSSDGKNLAATVSDISTSANGYIYVSTDYGVTWTSRTAAGQHVWTSISGSSDGNRLIAANKDENLVYLSADRGVSWTQVLDSRLTTGTWNTVAASASGQVLIVGSNATANTIYVSNDFGVSWSVPVGLPSGQSWATVTVSGDGTTLAAAITNGTIYGTSQVGLQWNTLRNTLLLDGNTATLQLASVSGTPSAPSSGNVALFSQKLGGKMHLLKEGPAGDFEAVQASFWQNAAMYWVPAPTNVGTWIGTGGVTAGSAVAVLPSTTNTYTQMRRSTFGNVVTTTNQQLGIRSDTQFYRGTSALSGGFFLSARFGFDSIKSGMRAFVGFAASTNIVNGDFSTLSNLFGFGFDTLDNSFSFVHCDGTVGNVVKEPISGQGTLATNNTGYDAYIWAVPGGGSVYYRLVRTDTGATLVESSVNTVLPAPNQVLLAAVHMSNGTANTNANDALLGINRLYVESNR